VPLYDPAHHPVVALAYVAYRLDGADPARRPVSFVVNGGPGMSSAWLHLLAIGPWRLPIDPHAISPSVSPALIDNPDTWLDFTDLVFIDPAGTGYSRFLQPGEQIRRELWSVSGDIDALGDFVRRWLEENHRLLSPKYFVGESYGGFRGPKLVQNLRSERGIGIAGMVLLSPAFSLGILNDTDNPLWWAARLPSMAAAARAKRGPLTRASLADAEDYAAGDYLHELLRGPNDPAEVARMSGAVAALTGIDPALIRRHGGRLSTRTFLSAFSRAEGRVGSVYDDTVSMRNPDPAAAEPRYPDPVLDGLMAPLTSAVLHLYAAKLDWRPEGEYRLSNSTAYGEWNFGKGMSAPESVDNLRSDLALDPRLRVLIEQGYFDLVTPYFGTQILLNQLPEYPQRLRFDVHEGGHMFYLDDRSRAALREEAESVIAGG
jgi:carboxypeptidase C (cathepsin A)